MKKILFAIVAASLSISGSAFAANAQNEKMKECNKQASEKQLKGKDRGKFMYECLKAAPGTAPAAAPAAEKKELPPKEAMGACAKAGKEKGLKGPDQKKFMSDCLKAKGPANMK